MSPKKSSMPMPLPAQNSHGPSVHSGRSLGSQPVPHLHSHPQEHPISQTQGCSVHSGTPFSTYHAYAARPPSSPATAAPDLQAREGGVDAHPSPGATAVHECTSTAGDPSQSEAGVALRGSLTPLQRASRLCSENVREGAGAPLNGEAAWRRRLWAGLAGHKHLQDCGLWGCIVWAFGVLP